MSWLRSHARPLAFLWVVLLVQVLELLLLERKYDLFTGGFLQPHSFLSVKERAVFLGISLWMDVFLYGVAALISFRLASRWKVKPLLAAYNYAFLLSATLGGWLVVKYKILSYFNDTLNFLIVQNLGGGSLYQALTFVSHETTIFGITALCLVAAYWLGLRSLRRISIAEHTSSENRLIRMWSLAAAVVITVGLVHWINTDSALHDGLRKKTSFALISTTLNRATDIDLDGFGFFSHLRDPAPFDATIYPGALDIPENGVDEDGYAGDFQWLGGESDPLATLPSRAGDHIVLIVLESARGDLVDRTAGGQEVAPVISALARSGTSLPYVYSHAGFTVTSLKALLNRTLSDKSDRVSLTDYLKRSGYQLSFISGEDESFGRVASETGMTEQGTYLFDARTALEDRVYPSKNPGSLRLSEERVARQFSLRVGEVDWDLPQFFYINFQAAHFPYHHPNMPAILNERPIPRTEISEENREWLADTYWNAIAVADRSVGRIVNQLEKLGVLDQTVIMILGDHGESLFDDHFLGHGHALNEIQTRIPLVVNRPGLGISCALGQADIAELLVKVATDQLEGDICEDSGRPVLQFVGSLDNPQLVGTVSFGEVRTTLDLRTRLVYFSDLKRWERLDVALNDPDLGARVSELLKLWQNKRWQNNLSRKAARIGTN